MSSRASRRPRWAEEERDLLLTHSASAAISPQVFSPSTRSVTRIGGQPVTMARPIVAYDPWADSSDLLVEDSRDKMVADSRDKVGNQVRRGRSSESSDYSRKRFRKARHYIGKPRGRTRSRTRRRRRRLKVKKGKDVSDDLSDMTADSQNKARSRHRRRTGSHSQGRRRRGNGKRGNGTSVDSPDRVTNARHHKGNDASDDLSDRERQEEGAVSQKKAGNPKKGIDEARAHNCDEPGAWLETSV